MNLHTALHTLRLLDNRRPPVPGEHWITLGLGLRLLLAHRRSVIGRALAMAAGAALVYRAIGGRDGLLATLRDDLPPVEGRRTTVMDGTVIASAAEPVPARPADGRAHDVAGASI